MPAAHYHLHATNGTASKGYSAGEHYAYVAREGKYSDPEKASEDLVLVVSENMPAWAVETPALYWQAADQFERDNAVLYKEVEFALPHGLSPEQRIDVALEMARDRARTSDGKSLPFSLAIHAGKNGANWNAHLMISERVNDGIERDEEKWFSRAAASPRKRDKETQEWLPSRKQIDPSKGGAKKTTELRPKTWLLDTRKRWAEIGNAALERAGRDERLDHRSLEVRGVPRIPQIHVGRKALEMGDASDRVATNREIIEANKILAQQERGAVSADLEAAEKEARHLGHANKVRRTNTFLLALADRIETSGTSPLRREEAAIAVDAVFPPRSGCVYGQANGKGMQVVQEAELSGRVALKGLADLVVRRLAAGYEYAIGIWKGKERQLADLIRASAERQLKWDSAVLLKRERVREDPQLQRQNERPGLGR